MTPTVFLWDIDGTLLTTARAGIYAWEWALRDELGLTVDLATLDTAGLTDPRIALLLAERHAGRIDAPLAGRLLARYEDHLPAALPLRQGRVLPGVRTILDSLRGRPGYLSLLLTGNTPRGAQAKLSHYGLWDMFPHGGAFASDSVDRADVARAARDLARCITGIRELRAVVIGDTPHDIACARAIDGLSVAVATGPYAYETLETHRPNLLLRELPPPDEFLSRVSLAAQGVTDR